METLPGESAGTKATSVGRERFIYVPLPGAQGPEGDQVDLLDIVRTLWDQKWLISAFAFVAGMAAIVYALTATQWYRAEVVMSPVEQRSAQGVSSQLGSLGGLAGLVGIPLGGGSAAEPLAVLQSQGFIREFIEGENLVGELGKAVGGDLGSEELDIRDFVAYFRDSVLTVSQQRETRLVTVGIEWTDPALAASWVNKFVARINEQMRARSLQQAESSIEYLNQELASANVVTLQQSIGRLLESELQKAMLARVNAEFAFRIIDPADVPKYRVRPRRTQAVMLGTLAGGFAGVFFVLLRRAIRRAPPRAGDRSYGHRGGIQ